MAEAQPYVKTPQEYVAVFLRRKKLAVFVIVVVTAIAVIVAQLLPTVYKSKATILIEAPEVPPGMVQSTVTSFADERIQTITQRATTTKNIREIVDKYNLYTDKGKRPPIDEVVARFKKAIDVKTIEARVLNPSTGRASKATIAFTLSFEYSNPVVSQKVVNELVTIYLSANLQERREQAAETTKFLAQEANRLEARIAHLEKSLAQFKEKNAGQLPDQLSMNMSAMERTDSQILELDRQIEGLKKRRAYLKAQLAATPRDISRAGPGGTPTPGGVESIGRRLEDLRAQYAKIRSIYGDEHPELIRISKEIAILEQEEAEAKKMKSRVSALVEARADLEKARQLYSPNHPEVRRAEAEYKRIEKEVLAKQKKRGKTAKARKETTEPTNPIYITMESELNSIETELKGLIEQRVIYGKRHALYEKRVMKTPEVERSYLGLVRDYDNAKKKYEETRNKQLAAELSQALETERKSERFSLIEPPQVPQKPEKPNKPLIAGLGFLAAIGMGGGLVFLLDLIDNRIYGHRQLASIIGEAPLVSIPHIWTKAEKRRRIFYRILFVIACLATIALAALAIHFLFISLNDFIDTLVRKVHPIMRNWGLK